MKDTTKIKGIYKIVNKINNKYYLGSSKDVHCRWRKHKERLRNNRHCNGHLQNAWNKYKEKNFEFVLLKEASHDITKKSLISMEQSYLDSLKPWNPSVGYNINKLASGGDWWENHPRRKELILMFRKRASGKNNIMYGKRHSNITKRKISQSGKERFLLSDSPFKGKTHKPESKRLMSKSAKLRYRNSIHPKLGTGKPVRQIDFGGNIIKIWKSAKLAADGLNKKWPSDITQVCRRHKKSAYGYRWEYEK